MSEDSKNLPKKKSEADVVCDGEYRIPDEHKDAISILFEETNKRDRCVRRAEEKYLESHGALWDKLRAIFKVDTGDPSASKLIYDHSRFMMVEGGKTRRALQAERDGQMIENHALVTEIRELKKSALAVKRFETAHVARTLETEVTKLLGEVKGARDELQAVRDELSKEVKE
jgi:hypothetical protein